MVGISDIPMNPQYNATYPESFAVLGIPNLYFDYKITQEGNTSLLEAMSIPQLPGCVAV